MVFDALGRGQSATLPLEPFRRATQDGLQRRRAPFLAILSPSIKPWLDQLPRFPTLKETVGLLVEQALGRARGNQREAALMLGITPQALCQRLKKRLL